MADGVNDMGQCITHKNPCLVSVKDLMEIILAPDNDKNTGDRRPFDEVYHNIFLGGDQSFLNQTTVARQTAVNESELQQLGITHVLNAAKGTKKFSHVNTDADFYSKSGIIFHGIPATDILTFKINKYFKEASSFIESAVGSKAGAKKDGKVYVHCKEGVSRSATLVLAYLITYQDMNITDAVRTVKSRRRISPNPGFLQQLIDYATKLDHCR